MGEDRFEKIALLFDEAVEIPTPEEQAAFLDRACSGDPDLRRHIDILLGAHRDAGKFLRNDAQLGEPSQPGSSDSGGLKIGDYLGHYRLLGLVGEGASSIVYLAEQEQPIRRWVALKVIKAGMDTRQVVMRFELERQALAVMDHPGIAKELDGGTTPNGRPFFVMELVRGTEITRHCDEHRLNLKERLELFIEVCQAVLHAHQKGIVHRDIKPDNVLVCMQDGRAVPKVIDFGLAKVLQKWDFSNTPHTYGLPFLGTPAYMSPEQAQGTMPDLDTRTDIYSLGALLYELLVGHPPFDHQALIAGGLDEMCHIIRWQEPAKPSLRLAQLPLAEQRSVALARRATPEELRRAVSGDLEWITLKAIEKERARRYESAASLLDDIRRHLHHLPVSAAAPSLRYRFSKLVRRNRKAVMTTGAFAMLLLAGTVALGIMGLRERSSASKARRLQTVALRAEQQSLRALVGVQISSALMATEEANYDRAILWFANAAQVAGQDTPDCALHLRRARAWLERTPVPIGAFQLTEALKTLDFCAQSKCLLAVDRNGVCQVWNCVECSPVAWVRAVEPVVAAAWHPDGRRLVLALKDNRVVLRRAADGAVLRSVTATEAVRAVGFSLSGEYLLFGGRTVCALNVATGTMLEKTWPHPQDVVGFGSTSQTDQFVTACLDGKARVLSLADGAEGPLDGPSVAHRPAIRVDGCSSQTSYRQGFLEVPEVSVPALAAGGTRLVTRTAPYEISLWDTGTLKLVRTLEGMCCSCRFMVNSEDRLLAGAFQGGRVGIWEVTTGAMRALLTSSGACILDLAFGPGGESLISAEAHAVVRLWSISEASAIRSSMHHSAEVDKVAFARKGGMVATGQGDGLVRVWALPDEWKGHRIASHQGPKFVRMDPERHNFVISREPGWKGKLRNATIYSASTGKPVGPTIELDGNLEDVALSPGSRQAAIALSLGESLNAGALEFRDIRTGRMTGYTSLTSPCASLSWEPNGERLTAICHSGELLVMEPGSNAPVSWAEGSGLPMQVHPFVAFSPDGASLVCLTPQAALEVRDAATGHLRYPALSAEPVGFWHFATSQDGRLLAGASRGGEVEIWNLSTGTRQVGPLHHPGPVHHSRFSSDGDFLVTANQDGRSYIWDVRTGEMNGTPLAHPNEVYDAAFTPDGNWVVTACRDGSVRMWERQSGQLVAPPYHVGGQAFTVEITADGHYAVIGSLDNAIHVLSLAILQNEVPTDTAEMCLLAEVVSGSVVEQGRIRDLTTAEWLQKERQLRRLSPRRVLLKRTSAPQPFGR